MSEETKTNEPVKQEGDFKIKSKKPKQLGNKEQEIKKVNLKEPLVQLPPEVTKVVVPSDELKKEDDAIQIGETEKVDVGEQAGDSVKMDEQVSEPSKTIEEFNPLSEVTEEEVKKVTKEIKEAVRDEKVLGKALPENIEKLVTFMEETGGTIEDYTRLNADYSNIDENTLLKEYYKKAKPHLDSEEINFIMEENFDYDTDIDEERDVKRKKLAKKEEIAKAKGFLDDLKDKYYEEIKLRPGITQEQSKAMDFFNRYNERQTVAEQQKERFKQSTKQLFNQDFKGFDINVGDKKFKYNVQNPEKISENQSNIEYIAKKFLDKNGDIKDTSGYHKAIYAADNVDKIASHFYEQGKADAVKEVISSSKNPTLDKARKQSSGEVFIGGLKVKAISGLDSTKLKIKKTTFN
jgi:hypothetical protein|tara:strand:+ start:1633 stop:2850 length:1218 start_codon:yes stop_codon:yes gene_type:complete